MKRLAIFLDGTWNDPVSNTNAWRLKVVLAMAFDEHLAPVTDAYRTFVSGVYHFLGRKHFRLVERSRSEKQNGFVDTVGEVIDGSDVWNWKEQDSYRPQNPFEWDKRTGKDAAALADGG